MNATDVNIEIIMNGTNPLFEKYYHKRRVSPVVRQFQKAGQKALRLSSAPVRRISKTVTRTMRYYTKHKKDDISLEGFTIEIDSDVDTNHKDSASTGILFEDFVNHGSESSKKIGASSIRSRSAPPLTLERQLSKNFSSFEEQILVKESAPSSNQNDEMGTLSDYDYPMDWKDATRVNNEIRLQYIHDCIDAVDAVEERKDVNSLAEEDSTPVQSSIVPRVTIYENYRQRKESSRQHECKKEGPNTENNTYHGAAFLNLITCSALDFPTESSCGDEVVSGCHTETLHSEKQDPLAFLGSPVDTTEDGDGDDDDSDSAAKLVYWPFFFLGGDHHSQLVCGSKPVSENLAFAAKEVNQQMSNHELLTDEARQELARKQWHKQYLKESARRLLQESQKEAPVKRSDSDRINEEEVVAHTRIGETRKHVQRPRSHNMSEDGVIEKPRNDEYKPDLNKEANDVHSCDSDPSELELLTEVKIVDYEEEASQVKDDNGDGDENSHSLEAGPDDFHFEAKFPDVQEKSCVQENPAKDENAGTNSINRTEGTNEMNKPERGEVENLGQRNKTSFGLPSVNAIVQDLEIFHNLRRPTEIATAKMAPPPPTLLATYILRKTFTMKSTVCSDYSREEDSTLARNESVFGFDRKQDSSGSAVSESEEESATNDYENISTPYVSLDDQLGHNKYTDNEDHIHRIADTTFFAHGEDQDEKMFDESKYYFSLANIAKGGNHASPDSNDFALLKNGKVVNKPVQEITIADNPGGKKRRKSANFRDEFTDTKSVASVSTLGLSIPVQPQDVVFSCVGASVGSTLIQEVDRYMDKLERYAGLFEDETIGDETYQKLIEEEHDYFV